LLIINDKYYNLTKRELFLHFIEALKLRQKLFFLFVLITLGLIAIGIMGALNVNNMKKHIDSVYFGSLVPVSELNEILQTYHGNLVTSVYLAKSSEKSRNDINSKIKMSIANIDKIWKGYESHFKRDEEIAYIDYVSLEIKSANDYFSKIIQASDENKDLTHISIDSLEKHVSQIHQVLKKLINYEVEVAKSERKNFLSTYTSTMVQVGFTLAFTIIAVLFISFYVFKSIQNDQTRLEIATKKLKRANKKLENVSYTDALTTLHNRRYFNVVYERELKRAQRTHSYLTFMMLDIDYFKQYNDTYGHIEGDHALKSVAKVLKDTLQRPSDFVFRLGGEEFAILATQTNVEDSTKLAQKICDSVREREILHENSNAHKFLTISIGVVCCIADDALHEDMLIVRADSMLYEAKENGRNRCEVTTQISEATPQTVEEKEVATEEQLTA
jgi:diguanylate cyclase (GGDEF)-like protein